MLPLCHTYRNSFGSRERCILLPAEWVVHDQVHIQCPNLCPAVLTFSKPVESQAWPRNLCWRRSGRYLCPNRPYHVNELLWKPGWLFHKACPVVNEFCKAWHDAWHRPCKLQKAFSHCWSRRVTRIQVTVGSILRIVCQKQLVLQNDSFSLFCE